MYYTNTNYINIFNIKDSDKNNKRFSKYKLQMKYTANLKLLLMRIHNRRKGCMP